jgi:hypothetical protein
MSKTSSSPRSQRGDGQWRRRRFESCESFCSGLRRLSLEYGLSQGGEPTPGASSPSIFVGRVLVGSQVVRAVSITPTTDRHGSVARRAWRTLMQEHRGCARCPQPLRRTNTKRSPHAGPPGDPTSGQRPHPSTPVRTSRTARPSRFVTGDIRSRTHWALTQHWTPLPFHVPGVDCSCRKPAWLPRQNIPSFVAYSSEERRALPPHSSPPRGCTAGGAGAPSSRTPPRPAKRTSVWCSIKPRPPRAAS